MATVTGYTAARMKQIEDETVVDGNVVGDHLILITRGTSVPDIDAGVVKGDQGVMGPVGTPFTAGMLMMFAGGVLPTSWLLCDGSPVSRTTYSALYGVVGTSYGPGNGSSTFNLPDLSVKFPVGIGSAPYNTLGATGGAEKVALAQAELASHSHNMTHSHTASAANNGSHFHTYQQTVLFFGADPTQGGQGNGPATRNTSTDGLHSHGITVDTMTGSTQNTGTGTPHNNMPPYVVVNYMIHI